MRATCLAALFVALFVSAASASGQFFVAFYADRNGTSCDIAANNPGFLEVHVVLEGSGLATGTGFRALKPPCMRSAVWIADAWNPEGGVATGTLGNTQHPDGVGVFFVCHSLPVYLGRIMYIVTEPTDPCCRYEPTPFLGEGPPYNIKMFLMSECNVPNFDLFSEAAQPKGVVMNPNASCMCDLPLPVHDTTWGAVKALYR